MKYLETEFYTENPDELNILEWWKNKQGHFPTLSLIARFVLDDRRSTMSSDILEGLICFKGLRGCKKAKTKQ